MTDYRQELLPPHYRNLVLNPGGEGSSLGAGFTASNGVVRVGPPRQSAPLPYSGSGLVEYEVTANTGNSYALSPFGPMEVVHRGAFKIPEGRTLSFAVSVRANPAAYVEIKSEWLVENWVNGAPAGVTRQSITSLGTVEAVNNSDWVDITVLVPEGDVPRGVTHWRPQIALFSSDPRTSASKPGIGAKLWADNFFVSDSGADISLVWPADGNTPGWVWEGDKYYSSSRTVDDEVVELPNDDVASTGYDSIADPVVAPADIENSGVQDLTPTVNPVEPPPVLDAALDDAGVRSINDRPAYAEAETVIGWRSSNRRIHLHEDVQLGDLVLNRMDEHGVVWLVSDLEGWWTTPEPDVPDVGRAWFDGSYETRGRYNARFFTITGSFVPRHPGDVAAARDRLIRASNLVHRGDWFMTHETLAGEERLSKGAKVWLAGQPQIVTTGQNGKTDFQIPLRSPNPVKQSIKDGIPPGYNSMILATSNSEFPEREYPRSYPWSYPETVFGNTVVQVVNEGNADVWPVMRIAGPTNGVLKVYNVDTEQTFRVVRKLHAGEVLEIDCFTKQVTLNGQGNHRFYLDIDVDWLMLQPGPNKIYFVEETLGALKTELEIKWRSGWIG